MSQRGGGVNPKTVTMVTLWGIDLHQFIQTSRMEPIAILPALLSTLTSYQLPVASQLPTSCHGPQGRSEAVVLRAGSGFYLVWCEDSVTAAAKHQQGGVDAARFGKVEQQHV